MEKMTDASCVMMEARQDRAVLAKAETGRPGGPVVEVGVKVEKMSGTRGAYLGV